MIACADQAVGIEPAAQAASQWLLERVSSRARLTLNSRAVKQGDVFFALPGANTDGRRFVAQAFQAGAAAVVAEQSNAAPDLQGDNLLLVPNLQAALGAIAHLHYGKPSQQQSVIAVTGTNGKTSVSQWIAQALQASGTRAGVIGTLGAGPVGRLDDFGMTTPDCLSLHGLLADFLAMGLQATVFEASSIGIEEQRLNGVCVTTAVYTNLSQDHLDYHGTMQRYAQAKARLFASPGLRNAVVNLDDEHAGLMLGACSPGTRKIGYTRDRAKLGSDLNPAASLVLLAQARSQQQDKTSIQPLRLSVWENQRCRGEYELDLPLVGEFNISNALAVGGALLAHGMPDQQVIACLQGLNNVPGRMQVVALNGNAPLVVVDYAHTPDALAKALTALQAGARAKQGRLIVVFGAGGDRDAGKRPLMGAVADRLADVLVVTSDNPRSEDPDSIVTQIFTGIPAGRRDSHSIPDRAEAIAFAVRLAGRNDVVLVAGKGHETYQEIAGRKLPFDDAQVVSSVWGAHG